MSDYCDYISSNLRFRGNICFYMSDYISSNLSKVHVYTNRKVGLVSDADLDLIKVNDN